MDVIRTQGRVNSSKNCEIIGFEKTGMWVFVRSFGGKIGWDLGLSGFFVKKGAFCEISSL